MRCPTAVGQVSIKACALSPEPSGPVRQRAGVFSPELSRPVRAPGRLQLNFHFWNGRLGVCEKPFGYTLS